MKDQSKRPTVTFEQLSYSKTVPLNALGELLTGAPLLHAVRRAIEGVAVDVREIAQKAKSEKASIEFGLELGLALKTQTRCFGKLEPMG